MPKERPVIGITTGDPAGIGPEISLKAICSGREIRDICRPVLIGNLGWLETTATNAGLQASFAQFDSRTDDNDIEVYDPIGGPLEFPIGIESVVSGNASAKYIEAAVELWRKDSIDAICTAPISKKAIGMAGYNFPGHTEFLASLTDTSEFAMSFFANDLRVVLLSTHVSLKGAIDLVKKDDLVNLIKFAHEHFGRLLGRSVSIAVAGLNPHASEDGLFGSEEADEIQPAIAFCQQEGIDVSGPFSPDTIFLRGFRREFDVVVACYHDQATIAVKSLSFGSAVNVTLGLPLIRTSVDHGTAFDIAGKNIADSSSMKAAIRLAAELVGVSENNKNS